MSKKITEIGSGGFRPGSDAYNLGKHRINTPGPSAGADSSFSRMSQFASRKLDIEEEEDEEDDILEDIINNKKRHKLIETLKNMLMSDDENEEDEEELEEFSGSGAAGGGPAVPLGYTSKGKPETPSQRKKRQNFNATKSFPYTSVRKEGKINRTQLRNLIYDVLNESDIKN